MRFQLEQSLFSQFQRLPALNSEFCALDTLLGKDEEFGFEDYLNGNSTGKKSKDSFGIF